MIAATTCSTVPIPKRNLQLCVGVCFCLSARPFVRNGVFCFAQQFSCMAIVQPFILQPPQLDHSLLLVSSFLPSLRTWLPVPHFLSSSVLCPSPSLHSVVLFVRFPWPTNKSRRTGDGGTIHGPHMVFIFLTAVQSQSYWVLPVVWKGKGGQIEWERGKKEQLNKIVIRKSLRWAPLCSSTKFAPLIPLTIPSMPSIPALKTSIIRSSFLLALKKQIPHQFKRQTHQLCSCHSPSAKLCS